MKELKIDKNISMPQSMTGKKHRYPFQKMNMGDSFFIKNDKEDKYEREKLRNAILGSASRYKPMKFTTRYLPDEGGYRCWRIK